MGVDYVLKDAQMQSPFLIRRPVCCIRGVSKVTSHFVYRERFSKTSGGSLVFECLYDMDVCTLELARPWRGMEVRPQERKNVHGWFGLQLLEGDCWLHDWIHDGLLKQALFTGIKALPDRL